MQAGREAHCVRTELQVRPEALIFSQSMMGYGAAIVRAMGPLLSSIEKTSRTTSNILPPHAYASQLGKPASHPALRCAGWYTTFNPSPSLIIP